MNANDIVRLALRSPLQVFMGDTMLITVTGRRTGRSICLPVSYYQDGDALWVMSSRSRKWWRNLKQGAPVLVHLHGRDSKGFAEAVVDEKVVANRLNDYVRCLPSSARYLGTRIENGIPNRDDVARLARERVFIKVCLEG
jgi:F420H(2)-dependent quinone reductase